MKAASADPKVNATRDGKFVRDEQGKMDLKRKLVEFVSSATGGPLKYTGKSMKEAHKGMGITNAEFDAAMDHLRGALIANNLPPADVAEALKIVGSTRKDIVEEPKKKPEDKKPVDKKPDDKKPPVKVDDKKPAEKKVEPKNDTEETAQLEGKIMFQGKPASPAYVTLVGKQSKRSFSTFIQKDGTYRFRNPVPVGQYAVILETGPREPGDPPSLNVPPQYRSIATSGLQCEVKTGNNSVDLNLR
jgi:hypothetical protein